MISEPLIASHSKGGVKALPFIIVNSAFEKLASFGLSPNMILYLTREYKMEAAKAANVIFMWSAATNFMPILGAFLADSYVGRFRMISFGSVVSLLGMILLWLTTIIPDARPPPCVQFGDNCQSATLPQLLLLYSSFALMSLGAGGVRSSSLAFGAQQLTLDKDGANHENSRILESYFGWYLVILSVSMVFAMTCIVYVQDAMGWTVGFGVPVVLMILSSTSFFLASPLYFQSKPKPSLLTGLAQVISATYYKRWIPSSSKMSNQEYYHGTIDNALPLPPSGKLRFLNKACIIENPEEEVTADRKASNPWKLCTVEQVEELKSVIKIIPIWSSGMIVCVIISQASFVALQASTMNRHITSNFQIPAGSFAVFAVISLAIWISLYDRVIIPVASKLKGKQVHLSLKQRMGIGIILSSVSMSVLAITEQIRRSIAIKEGFSDDPNAVVDMSAMWLLPHFVFGGLAEGFNLVAQNEFYYTELPKCMSSIASTLVELGASAANLVSSLILASVNSLSRTSGGETWVSSNINRGHYDYYYWVIAVLLLLNFVYYLVCSESYGPCRGHENNELDDQRIRGHP